MEKEVSSHRLSLLDRAYKCKNSRLSYLLFLDDGVYCIKVLAIGKPFRAAPYRKILETVNLSAGKEETLIKNPTISTAF